MTLLTVAQDVCAVVGVERPTTIFGNINAVRTQQELLAVANEAAHSIAFDTRDWQVMQATAIFTGDAVTTAFPLPSNYRRMLLSSNVWRSTSTIVPMRFVDDPDEWMRRRLANYFDSQGEWIILNGQINIVPAMGVGISARFTYYAGDCVALQSPPALAGTFSPVFQNDGDNFRLGDRLLKLAMIWKWKALKGSPYAEDMSTYETALANLAGRDKPSPILVQRSTISRYARVAYPYPLPNPWP